MKRRHFLKHSAITSAGAFVTPHLFASEHKDVPERAAGQPFKLNYGIHDGMFRNSAGADFFDQIKFAYDAGFRAIEDNGMMDRDANMQERIGDLLVKMNMQMGVFVLNFDHWPVHTSLTSGNKDWMERFLKSCREAVEVSKRCHGKLITVVPGNYENSLSLSFQTANVVDALRRAAAIFEPHGVTMVIESLSDTPDLFLRHSDQAFMVCKAVQSPSCKFLFDMYHMQRNEGDIINNIDRVWDEIGYFQIGDNPGRKEPGTGEMNYKNIFRHIYNKGYKGVMGMEHGISLPGKDGEEQLIRAYRECDSF